MLTWHSRLQDRSEGGGFLLALDINIFTCCDVGPSWVYKQFHSLGIKKLHCFRDLLTFSVSPQISVWQTHTKNFPLQATGNFIFFLLLFTPGHTACVSGM